MNNTKDCQFGVSPIQIQDILMHIYCSFHKYEVHKFKLSQPFVLLLALMSGSAHRAGGSLAEGSIKYNERNRNVYLGKVCAQMYTMKTRGYEPTFSKNERKCAATARFTC